jgi:hypothetical protein
MRIGNDVTDRPILVIEQEVAAAPDLAILGTQYVSLDILCTLLNMGMVASLLGWAVTQQTPVFQRLTMMAGIMPEGEQVALSPVAGKRDLWPVSGHASNSSPGALPHPLSSPAIRIRAGIFEHGQFFFDLLGLAFDFLHGCPIAGPALCIDHFCLALQPIHFGVPFVQLRLEFLHKSFFVQACNRSFQK